MLPGAPVAAGLRRRGFRGGCGVAGRPSGRVGRLSCRGAAGAVLLRCDVRRGGAGRVRACGGCRGRRVDRLGVGAVVGEQWYVVRVGGGGDGKVERAHLSERVGELAGELLEVFLDGPGRGCLPDLGEFGAADPVAASCGAELGDGPAGGGDRELLAGFGASQDFGDVVAQFLLRDHGHGHGGGRTRGLWRFRRSRGYLLGSAEPAGAVKASSSEPSAASCAAVALTGAVRRSYRLALGCRAGRERSAASLRLSLCGEAALGGPLDRRPALGRCLERDVLVIVARAGGSPAASGGRPGVSSSPRGLAPYSSSTSCSSSATRWSPAWVTYSRGSKRPEKRDGLALDQVLGGGRRPGPPRGSGRRRSRRPCGRGGRWRPRRWRRSCPSGWCAAATSRVRRPLPVRVSIAGPPGIRMVGG